MRDQQTTPETSSLQLCRRSVTNVVIKEMTLMFRDRNRTSANTGKGDSLMAMIRKEGKIDGHTYLIDAVHQGVSRGHAVYLLKSSDGGTCLIDSGTKRFRQGHL